MDLADVAIHETYIADDAMTKAKPFYVTAKGEQVVLGWYEKGMRSERAIWPGFLHADFEAAKQWRKTYVPKT